MKNFDTFAVMIDMSRNAVMSIDGLKRFLPLLAHMGYNCLMLYTEDTYEVDGEPYFGYMRGRYTKAEMKEIDAFSKKLGIEVIPCVQTLAHLRSFFRWGKVAVDREDIMMADDDRTYELIDHMFATLSECFSSRNIHIGMDEAHMLGRGVHLDRFGYEQASVIMKRHLAKVCEIAAKYGYQNPMVWSDMFFRTWNNGNYYMPESKVPQEIIDSVPEHVTPVYWDYYHTDENFYIGMLRNHKQMSNRTWFAGGAWCWNGMIPHNQFSIKSMIPAINACKKERIRNFVMTLWGDDGAECSHFSQLPALFYLAEYAKGNRDEKNIKLKFNQRFGIPFDDFMRIDSPNNVVEYEGTPCNPSKYMLFSDCFSGFLDYTVKPGAGKRFADFSADLSASAKKSRRYGYVFDSASKLCDVLELKYELGLRTRNAYQNDDRETLKKLANEDYPEVIRRLKIFHKAFEKQWMIDNKAYGFEVQEMRLGGLVCRLNSCRRRLLAYMNGRISRIEELEEMILPYGKKEESISLNKASFSASTNVIVH